MKALAFTLLTDKGLQQIHCNQFWEQYCHCKEAHPEEEPIQSALEHILGGRLNSPPPPMVMQGCGEVVAYYTARAKPGNAAKARRAFADRYPSPADRAKLQGEAYRQWQMAMFLRATPTGPLQ